MEINDELDTVIYFDIMESGSNIVDYVYNENVPELKVLLDTGNVDLNREDKYGRTVLFAAACRGNTQVVQLLLDHGADVTVMDAHHNTALHWCGHVEIIELLVNYGADVTQRNIAGLTPKDMAKRRGVCEDVIQIYSHLEGVAKGKSRRNISPNLSVDHNDEPTLFQEFSKDIGLRNLCLLILGILALSLYVAWTVTGVSKHFEQREPIIVDTYNIKL